MTAKQWKELVLTAANTVSAWEYLLSETEHPKQEVREAVSVILESLPGVPDSEIERAMKEAVQYGISPTMADFANLERILDRAKSDEMFERTCARIIGQTMNLLAQVSLLDLSPSAHLD